mgnify:CR=1 FL=1
MQLSTYQHAVLQAMDVDLYQSKNALTSTESIQAAPLGQEQTPDMFKQSNHPLVHDISLLLTENHSLTWHIDDSLNIDGINIEHGRLTSPALERLVRPEAKRALWRIVCEHFYSAAWT